jgi:hypothetical protein
MPFKSAKQRAYLFSQEPKIAKRWVRKYGAKVANKVYKKK